MYFHLARKGLGPLTGDGINKKYKTTPHPGILKGHCPLSGIPKGRALWRGAGAEPLQEGGLYK